MQTASETIPSPPNAVEGSAAPGLRWLGLGVTVTVIGALGIGAWQAYGQAPWHAWAHAAGERAAVGWGLLIAEVVCCAALILLGSVVEGFGWGLSLGTQWPYTRNIVRLMWRGDPEAAHRILATLTGLLAVAFWLVHPGRTSLNGVELIAATALFGMGTLYVLAGRVPALVHGIHGLLAYLVLLNYLAGIVAPGLGWTQYLKGTIALHSVLFAVLLGGMVTGQRGFGRAIEPFVRPRKAPQWMLVLHGFAALLVLGTLGWLSSVYPVAFGLALLQASLGFFLFQALQLRPRAPGVVVAFHQGFALLIVLAIVFRW